MQSSWRRQTARGARRTSQQGRFRRLFADTLSTIGNAPPRQWFFEPLEERRMLDATVVFNELMYHPAAGGMPEWIELYNQMAVNVDLSGWKLSDAIDYTFPEGTVITGGAYLVITTDPAALTAQTGYVGALGPYTGSLSNSGEKIDLVDQNLRLMDEIDYKDDDQWPVAPDGSGVTLAKYNPNAASDVAANWLMSTLVEGTPGQRNFPPPSVNGPTYDTLVPIGASSKFRVPSAGDAALGTGWTATGFNDGAWTTVATGIGFDTDTPTPSTGTVNVALGKPVIKTSGSYAGLAGFEAQNVTDGSVSDIFSNGSPLSASYWLGREATANEFFTLDLQQSYSLKEIRLRNTHNTPYNDRGTANFQILASNSVNASNDLLSPVLILSGTLTAVTNQDPITAQVFTSANGLVAGAYRYLRFRAITSTYGNNNVGLNEIEVYAAGPARPVAYWPLNGSTSDASGNSNTGGIAGATYSNQTPPGLTSTQSLSFDGINDYFISPNLTVGMSSDESLTLSVWLRARSGGNGGVVVDELGQTTLNAGWHVSEIAVSPSGEVQMQVAGLAPISLGTTTFGDWHHVALRYTKATFALDGFLDGVLKATTNGDRNSPWESALPIYYALGSADSGGVAAGFFDGQMDDFAVYNKPLSNSQIAALATFTGPLDISGFLNLFATNVSAAMKNTNASSWLRTKFSVLTPGQYDQLLLSVQYDDGFVAYLNGQEIVRRNAPALTPWNAAAASDRPHSQAIVFEDIDLSSYLDDLLPGQNVLAIHGLNNIVGDASFLLVPKLTARIADPASLATSLAINEVAASTEATFSIELNNFGAAPLELGGYVLARANDLGVATYTLPAQSLAAGSYLTLSESTLAFDAANGDQLFLYAPGQQRVVDAVVVKDRLRGRFPDGNGDWRYPSAASFGAANSVVLRDEVVINEIMYHHRPTYTTPTTTYAESPEQWIELYSRSNHAVDLGGWRLDDGVQFTIPAGTTLAAGGYLVIAQDAPALLAKYPGIAVLGPLGGQLSNSGERIALKDAAGNLADEVHYYEDGSWDARADGGGSSLELRDPRGDNSQGGAWSASNELARTTWQHYSYTATAIAPVYDPVTNTPPNSDFRELRIGLLDTGEALIDNISVIENPGGTNVQLVQNGSFSGDTVGGGASKWRFLGTHSSTRVELDPSNAANQVLRVVAQSRADYLDNLLETTTVGNAQIVPGRTYQISFDARFLSGSPQLRAELYYNRVVTLQILQQPTLSGTPGSQNSTWQANAGLTYENLHSTPVMPAALQPTTVSVEASDPDGIATMTLYYSVAGGAWQTTAMSIGSGGNYTGAIPGQSAGTVVQFYVRGQDVQGAVTTYPAAGPLSRALIKWDDGQAQVNARHSFRMIMTQTDIDKLFLNTNLMSNERLGGTVVYDETEVFYDVGIRLRGSMFSRVNLGSAGYNISFPQEHLFRGVHSSVTMKTPGKEEILVKHSALQLGVPEMYDDFVNMVSPAGNGNGIAIMSMARYGDEFTTTQFEDGEEGTVFKMQGIRVIQKPAGAGPEDLKIYFPVGWVFEYDLKNLGNDQEQYRWSIQITNNRAKDDYGPIVAMMKSIGLDGLALEQAVANTIDVDQWMRVFALQSLWGIGDAYMQGNPHNLDFYIRPSDGKVLALPWDWNFVASYAYNSPLYGIENRTFTEVIDRPMYRRLFYGHMRDMILTSYNPAYLNAWATSYGAISGLDLSGYAAYTGQRGQYVLQQLNTLAPNVTFDVTTANGQSLNSATATVSGAGWIDVREIRVDGYSTPLTVTWTDFSHWQAVVPIAPGQQTLNFRAFNHQGVQVGTDTLTITSTLTGRPLQDYLRVSELQYHPADPSPAEIAAGFTNSDSFEFIELVNTGPQTLNLAGAKFISGVTFDFTNAAITTLSPGARLLVAENATALALRYGAGLPIAGQYSGKFDNAGEHILMVDSLNVAISDFTYSDTWYPSTDGQGPSLQAVSDAQSPAQLSLAAGWRASYAAQGTPAAGDPLLTSVVNRQVFYNNSSFDGNDNSPGDSDDGAIAAGKAVLLPGGTATFSNYTSYSRGINGVMIDVAGLSSPLTAADFEFRIGNDNNPAAWPLAPAPSSVSVRAGGGAQASTRVTIVWPDGAIKNTWLQVVMHGALATPDVFYVGNAVGETGDNAANAQVNATDELTVRNHPQTFLSPAVLSNLYDFNRDGLVNATDQILARANSNTLAGALKLISAPAGVQSAAKPAQALAADEVAAGLAAPLSNSSPTRQQPRVASEVLSVYLMLSDAASDADRLAILPGHDLNRRQLSRHQATMDNELFDLLAAEIAANRRQLAV